MLWQAKVKILMNAQMLQEAVSLAQEVGHVWLATADANKKPHIAAAGKIRFADGIRVAVTEWFCPGTLANLSDNGSVAVVVWKPDADLGYQLTGRLEKIKDLSILDGYEPLIEQRQILPQVQREILIRVDKVTLFKLGPHSDQEEKSANEGKIDDARQKTQVSFDRN